jgi:DNA mismatch repair protein MutL
MTDTQIQRSRIQLLPDGLINKIAAGEVVERPASVVKELLENAIDAGARRVSVAIEDGGRTLIRISDDGCGIPPEEAPLAFAQHATSKIRDSEDLFAITTMGFRGEALASIASVSHATMVTRTSDSQQAVRIEVKDSVVGGTVPCAASPGTTIEVRDLFYSVPARRKFLRTDSTEFSHIHEMVLRTALPNPHIALSLSNNGRLFLELPETTDHRMRVAEALGKDLYSQLIPVEFAERGIRVHGFAGQPSMARPTAKYQYLFLNGRYIRDRSLLHALKEAYRGLIEPASQPVAILFLEMDPALFDVNVHPQKTEVRFRDSGPVYRSVLAALREKLLASDLTPQVKVNSGQWPVVSGQQGGGTADETRKVIADFFKQTPPVQTRIQYGVETGGTRVPSPIEDPSRITFEKPEASQEPEVSSTMDAAAPVEMGNRPSAMGNPPARFVQLHNTYIVAETSEGVVIIDQHALHERILYEELFARAMRGPLEGQRLLIPEILPVNPRQAAALETVKGLLSTLGIEITEFDSGSVAVHSFPSLLSKVSPGEFLRELLDKLMELGSRLTPEEMLHEVLDMASCKAAVKAGYPLSSDEIAALLVRREQVDRSSNCPHGRPTTLRLTIGDLERQFKRK